MATFITTIKFTPQGVTTIQDTCKPAASWVDPRLSGNAAFA